MLADASELRDVLIHAAMEYETQTTKAEEQFAQKRQEFDDQHSSSQSERQSEFEKLKSGLEGITLAYETRMQLQGPVRYWRLRADQNRLAYRVALAILIVFSAGATYVLYCLYDRAASHLPTDGAAVPYAALFKAAAFACSLRPSHFGSVGFSCGYISVPITSRLTLRSEGQ